MKKKELRSGMVVERRDGERFLLVDFACEIVGVNMGDYWWLYYTQDNLRSSINTCFDIVKIFEAKVGTLYELLNDRTDTPIWSSSDEIEITSDEAFRILREHYDCEVKIIE